MTRGDAINACANAGARVVELREMLKKMPKGTAPHEYMRKQVREARIHHEAWSLVVETWP